MLVVIPFDNHYAAQAKRLLCWCEELSGKSRHPCLLVCSKDTKPEIFRPIESIANVAFSGVQVIKPTVIDYHKRPDTVNLFFRTTVRYVEKTAKQPFFWLEVDCVPLVADWLDRLETEYFQAGKPYMGFRRDIPTPHISGPAIYPPNVAAINPASLRDFHNHHGCISFDLVQGDKVLKNAHVTKLIHHEWGAKDKPPTFPTKESLAMISKDAVLFHRVKDGSLSDRLREQRPPSPEPTRAMNLVGDLMMSEQAEAASKFRVAVIYVYPNMGGQHDFLAKRFAASYTKFFPETPHTLHVVSNGGPPTATMRETFKDILCEFVIHDDTGWDIGAYRKAAKEIPCDLMVFFGGAAFLNGRGWLERMVASFEKYGDGIYGATGSLGHNIHIRTTGFWMPPKLLNRYPHPTTSEKASRYAFEHGKQNITAWVMEQKLKAMVVTFHGEYEWRDWDGIKNGFHNGNQSAVMVRDRLTEKPYHNT